MSKINIIVPVYNVADYLDAFFESLLAQTFQDYTLFIVNDCSTDSSKDIILSYQERMNDKLLYFENNENIKAGRTRNRGLEESEKCESEYTTFLDSDDWIEPDFLEHLYMTAVQKQCDLVVCGIERFEDGTNKRICVEAVNGPVEPVTNLKDFDELAYIDPSPGNKLYKSSKIKGYRFLSLKRSEDTCYFFEILPSLSSIVYTNKVAYHYRLNTNSSTGAFEFDVCQSMFDGFRKMYKLYERDEYIPFKEMFQVQIFIRSGCGGVCRASFSNMKNVRKNVRETYKYMNDVMPSWKNNRYLTLGKRRSKNIKQLALKCCALMYKLHIFGLFVWIYYFMLNVLKKDVRM